MMYRPHDRVDISVQERRINADDRCGHEFPFCVYISLDFSTTTLEYRNARLPQDETISCPVPVVARACLLVGALGERVSGRRSP